MRSGFLSVECKEYGIILLGYVQDCAIASPGAENSGLHNIFLVAVKFTSSSRINRLLMLIPINLFTTGHLACLPQMKMSPVKLQIYRDFVGNDRVNDSNL